MIVRKCSNHLVAGGSPGRGKNLYRTEAEFEAGGKYAGSEILRDRKMGAL